MKISQFFKNFGLVGAALFFSFLTVTLSPVIALAEKTKVTKADRTEINRVISKYRKSAMVVADLDKKAESKILKKESSEQGKLHFASGKIRYEVSSSDPVLVVFDGKYLWNVQLPSKDFGGEEIVSRAKIDQKNRQQLIVTELLTRESLFKHFNLNEVERSPGQMILHATPKKSDWNLVRLAMHFDLKADLVTRIEYWDDLNNYSSLVLNNQKFESEIKKSLFVYKAPKGVKVNEL